MAWGQDKSDQICYNDEHTMFVGDEGNAVHGGGGGTLCGNGGARGSHPTLHEVWRSLLQLLWQRAPQNQHFLLW